MLLDNITTVRWSSCGNVLATASWDTNIKLTEFSTGHPIYKAKTADESNKFDSQIFIGYLDKASSLCFLG